MKAGIDSWETCSSRVSYLQWKHTGACSGSGIKLWIHTKSELNNSSGFTSNVLATGFRTFLSCSCSFEVGYYQDRKGSYKSNARHIVSTHYFHWLHQEGMIQQQKSINQTNKQIDKQPTKTFQNLHLSSEGQELGKVPGAFQSYIYQPWH